MAHSTRIGGGRVGWKHRERIEETGAESGWTLCCGDKCRLENSIADFPSFNELKGRKMASGHFLWYLHSTPVRAYAGAAAPHQHRDAHE